MKISTNMLKRYLKTDLSDEKLYNLTNEYIAEVESLEKLLATENLVVGRVLEKKAHPNADKLSVCQVDLGNGLVEQIVCGAANVDEGQSVVVAKVDAVLPGNFLIKNASIRGISSNGMICSLTELGIDEKLFNDKYKDGIFYFDNAKTPGIDAKKELNLDQSSLELDLTPNRADLLSVLGFSYDLGAVLDEKIELIEPVVVEVDQENPLTVLIETDGCKRYYARYLDNVKIKPSPLWLQLDLIASGIRPVNNVVDVTNYVMLELGTPLHAFDADKFDSNQIVVKEANHLETVTTLDGEIRVLEKGDVVITNGKMPTAIGGVMGLLNTMIDENTTKVILEAATFEPLSIRKTSRRLDLISDSSVRFERGIDELRVRTAINRAAELLILTADARVYKNIKFAGKPFDRPTLIQLLPDYLNNYLGTTLSKDEIKAILKRLNIIETKPDLYLIPSYRSDLKIKADLTEEIARIYGYNNLPTTLPKTSLIGGYSKMQQLVYHLRKQIKGLGFNEVINYSLLKKQDINLFKEPSKDIIGLLKPLKDDRTHLRHSLINGLVENVKYHLSRQTNDLRFFEVGNVYYTEYEPLMLAAIIEGSYLSSPSVNVKSSFVLLKGMLESLLDSVDLKARFVEAKNIDGFHPHVLAKIIVDDKTVGFIGQVHPNILDNAFAFEVNLTQLFDMNKSQALFTPISKFPNITRDIAVLVKKDLPAEKIMTVISQTAKKYLVNLVLFDIYYDEKLGTDKVSLAFRLTFNSKEKTLQTEDIDKIIKSIVFRLENELSAVIR